MTTTEFTPASFREFIDSFKCDCNKTPHTEDCSLKELSNVFQEEFKKVIATEAHCMGVEEKQMKTYDHRGQPHFWTKKIKGPVKRYYKLYVQDAPVYNIQIEAKHDQEAVYKFMQYMQNNGGSYMLEAFDVFHEYLIPNRDSEELTGTFTWKDVVDLCVEEHILQDIDDPTCYVGFDSVIELVSEGTPMQYEIL